MNLSDLHPQAIDIITAKVYPQTFTYDDPAPYVVYATLKQAFGPPRGAARTHVQWSYELAAPSALIRIYDWRRYGWSIDIYPDKPHEPTAGLLAANLLEMFRAAAKKTAQRRLELAKNSRQYLIQNAYRIYSDSAATLLGLAEQIPNEAQRDTLCRSAFFLLLSSFEGLLNLIYELYLRPNIRAMKGMRSSIIKSGLDQKIFMGPVYCTCFRDEIIEFPGDVFKRYQAIRELRNDFVHANVEEAMKTAVHREDGHIFLLEASQLIDYQLPRVISRLNLTHLRFTQQVIEEMKQAVIDAMDVHHRRDFAMALEREEILVELDAHHRLIRKDL